MSFRRLATRRSVRRPDAPKLRSERSTFSSPWRSRSMRRLPRAGPAERPRPGFPFLLAALGRRRRQRVRRRPPRDPCPVPRANAWTVRYSLPSLQSVIASFFPVGTGPTGRAPPMREPPAPTRIVVRSLPAPRMNRPSTKRCGQSGWSTPVSRTPSRVTVSRRERGPFLRRPLCDFREEFSSTDSNDG